MVGIDKNLSFTPLSLAVLTVSDTRTEDNDTSGDVLQDRIEQAGHSVKERAIVRDTIQGIREHINAWITNPDFDAIVTIGGTGLPGRDVTVEAITPLFEKTIDGFSVIFHMKSYETVGLSTLQSRACAGLANGTLIFCLPGSNGGVKDGWDKVLESQLDSRHRPCNFVTLIPRFTEY